jgi:molybdopterin/thiamine biosynthesis adenylyltransferase
MSEETETEFTSPFLRFSSIIPGELMGMLKVTIIGAGGIGAPAALCLAKSGVSTLEIFDHDDVGAENTGPQMYGPGMVGQPKVMALRRFLRQQAPWTEVSARRERYDGGPIDADVVIAAVDSLSVRRVIWEGVKESPSVKLLVDPRMGAEILSVHSVIPHQDGPWYAATLEGKAVAAACTAKATFYTGLIAGAMCAQALKAFLCNERNLVECHLDLRFLGMLGMTQEQQNKVLSEKGAAA